MAFPARYVTAKASTSGAFTANDASSAVVTPSTVVNTADVDADSLMANVSIGLYTLNLAIRGKWQVSADNSTWSDFAQPNNAAQVTMQSSTGTFSTSVSAPVGVTGKKYARYALYIVGGSTGTASDTYTVSYSYRKRNPFDNRG